MNFDALTRRSYGLLWRHWFMIAMLSLLLSGCAAVDAVTGSFIARTPGLATPPSPAAPAISLDELSRNRILGIDRSGNLFTIDADGGNRFAITTDATANRVYSQPTWSPDGSYIAFTQVNNMQT